MKTYRLMKAVLTGAVLTAAGLQTATAGDYAEMIPDAIKDAGVIRNLVTVPNPPMEFQTEDGKTSGFDYDLALALGEELGIPVETATTPDFGAMATSLKSGRVDMLLGAMFDTKARQEAFDFVDYFITSNQFMVLKKDSEKFQGIAGLCGETIVAGGGTSFGDVIDEISGKVCEPAGLPKMEYIWITGIPAGLIAMKTGRAAGILLNVENVAAETQRLPDELASVPETFNPNVYGIAIMKGRGDFVSAVQTALQALIDNGTYGEIIDKYNLADGAIPEATVNQALN